MLQKSTYLHLRIPFSLFLMPVFLFASSQAQQIEWRNWLFAFVAIHFFLYPASNAYNSYFDKDEGSIGGLEHPPQVSRELYWVALLFDGIAITIAAFVSWQFAVALFVYGLVSKVYSHPLIRLKKYPIVSWLVVAFFQGFFTYLMSLQALENLEWEQILEAKYIQPAVLSSVLLAGSYPMTQVYQHQEDAKRGDKTLSLLLGVKGTFIFASVVFFLANLGFIAFFLQSNAWQELIIFEIALLPILAFFGKWFWQVLENVDKANFRNTMLLNKISSLSLSIAFVLIKLAKFF